MLVLGSSFLVTFLGWEGVGLCSYLLVSFWFERNCGRGGGQEGVRHQPRRRLRLPARDVPDLRVVRHRSTTRRCPRARTPSSSGTATAIALLLLVAAVGQERADPAAPLAARRDGGPHPGVGAHPRRHHGHRRRVPAVSAPTCSSTLSGDAMTVVAWVGRHHRAARGHRRASSSPTSNGCSRTPPSASSATCSSPSASVRTPRRCSWCCATRSTRAASSSAPAR